MNLPLVLLNRRRRGGTAFSPASLFASGEEGAWYEPSTTTCFTDTAGTTPAAVGDAVARINDLSGNGNHATQATASARPTLQQTIEGLYYLSFDGSDDGMATASIDFTATDKMSVFAGVEPNSASGAPGEAIVETSPSPAANDGAFGVFAPVDLGTSPSAKAGVGTVLRGTVATGSLNSGTYVGASHVFSILFDIAESTATTGEIVFRSDGSVVASSGDGTLAGNAGTGNFGNYPLNIGARNNAASVFFNGKIFGLIVRGASSTAQEISQTETYLAAKSGVTL